MNKPKMEYFTSTVDYDDGYMITDTLISKALVASLNELSQPQDLFIGATKDIRLQASNEIEIFLGTQNSVVIRDYPLSNVAFELKSSEVGSHINANSNNLLLTTANSNYWIGIGDLKVASSNSYNTLYTSQVAGFKFLNPVTIDGNQVVHGKIDAAGSIISRCNVIGKTLNVYKESQMANTVRTGYSFFINESDQLELVKYSAFSNQVEVTKRLALFGRNALESITNTDLPWGAFGDIDSNNPYQLLQTTLQGASTDISSLSNSVLGLSNDVAELQSQFANLGEVLLPANGTFSNIAVINNITTTTFTGSSVNSSNISATSGTITTLSGSNVASSNISATSGTITTLTGSNVASSNISATSGTIVTLSGSNIATSNISATSGTIVTLTGSNVASSNISATSGTIVTLTGSNVASSNISVTSGTIVTLSGSNVASSNISATSGTIVTLTGSNIATSNISSTTLTSSNVTVLGFSTFSNNVLMLSNLDVLGARNVTFTPTLSNNANTVTLSNIDYSFISIHNKRATLDFGYTLQVNSNIANINVVLPQTATAFEDAQGLIAFTKATGSNVYTNEVGFSYTIETNGIINGLMCVYANSNVLRLEVPGQFYPGVYNARGSLNFLIV